MATVQIGCTATRGLRAGASALIFLFGGAAIAAGPWQYSSSVDKMRGTELRWAEINSATRIKGINGPGALTIVVRRAGATEEVMFGLRNLIAVCGVSECVASVKFDDGQIRTVPLSRSSDGSGSILFVTKPAPFIQSLSKAKQLIVELDVFRVGRQQFVFDDVSGLSLPPAAPTKKK